MPRNNKINMVVDVGTAITTAVVFVELPVYVSSTILIKNKAETLWCKTVSF